MAKINLNAYAAADGIDAVKVGNNRTTEKPNPNVRVNCLYGASIMAVRYDFPKRRIELHTCGFRSATTRDAMKDFLQAETGLTWFVSFAGGKFSVTCSARRGVWFTTRDEFLALVLVGSGSDATIDLAADMAGLATVTELLGDLLT